MIRRRTIVALLAVILLAAAPIAARAAGLAIICETENSHCTIADFLQQFVTLSEFGLGLVGVLSVGMFLYAGFEFITAAGRRDKIDHGKHIIVGTIVGLVVSLTAFVIVNFTIAAITGTSTRTTGYVSGFVATVFGGRDRQIIVNGKKVNINRPFSGTGTGDDRTTCRGSNETEYNKECSSDRLQIFCADAGDEPSGVIHGWQTILNAKGCNCGAVDGCFGPSTFACVRRFQVANRLPPTGALDSTTQSAINATDSTACNTSFSDAITRHFPGVASVPAANTSQSDSGCCLVGGTGGSASYCVDNVSSQACAAMSGLSDAFDRGQYCASSRFRNTCGFCKDTRGRAFQFATQNWCTSVGFEQQAGTLNPSTTTKAPLSFVPGTCAGRNGIDPCKTAILLEPEN